MSIPGIARLFDQRGEARPARPRSARGGEATMYLLRSPRKAERLLEAVRGFEAGTDDGVPLT